MDIIRELGPVFLGTRLRRIADRFQASAAQVISDAGLPVQPSHMPVLTALERGPMTVGMIVAAIGVSQPAVTRAAGQLKALGLVESRDGRDRRERHLELTPDGRAAMARARAVIWPRVGAVVQALCDGLSGPLMDQLGQLEAQLDAAPLEARVRNLGAPGLTLVEFDDGLAEAFREINTEWIEAMFGLEPADRQVLDDPRGQILEPGGAILFVAADGLGVVGAGALRPAGPGRFELTKMAVRERARGLGAGRFLLDALLDRAGALGAREVFLLSNRKCAAAVRLYEAAGFGHDEAVMREHGPRYARSDVAMRRTVGEATHDA